MGATDQNSEPVGLLQSGIRKHPDKKGITGGVNAKVQIEVEVYIGRG